MTDVPTTRRPNPRSARLKIESDNCLAIAIREREPETAALLIDEAVRLALRGRELAPKP